MDYYTSWLEEKRSAYLYAILAESEKNILHRKLFKDLQHAAETQALTWTKKIPQTETLIFKPTLRLKIVGWLAKNLGAENMQSVLSAMKIRGMSVYPRFHSEDKHQSLNMVNNLRAAIFGVNDGLISNMSLILGVVGANTNDYFIILAGVAGLLAGACSMAAGEYISVKSQREVFEYQIAIEKQELEEYPEEEAEELSLIYQARGLPKEEAERLANFMIQNPETGLDTLAREELGLNPDDLVSPIGAMLSSFISFAIGATLPLLPFLFGHHSWNLPLSMGVTAITLLIIGSILSLYTNRNPLWSGLRMLLIGSIAGAITYVIGGFFGHTV